MSPYVMLINKYTLKKLNLSCFFTAKLIMPHMYLLAIIPDM